MCRQLQSAWRQRRNQRRGWRQGLARGLISGPKCLAMPPRQVWAKLPHRGCGQAEARCRRPLSAWKPPPGRLACSAAPGHSWHPGQGRYTDLVRHYRVGVATVKATATPHTKRRNKKHAWTLAAGCQRRCRPATRMLCRERANHRAGLDGAPGGCNANLLFSFPLRPALCRRLSGSIALHLAAVRLPCLGSRQVAQHAKTIA